MRRLAQLLKIILAMQIFTSACTVQNSDVAERVIRFDNSKVYPSLNLKLSDLADVSYVPLGGEEQINFLTPTFSLALQCYVDSNYIVVPDATPYRDVVSKSDDNIYFFNHSGEFVKSFGIGPKRAWDGNSYNHVKVISPGKIAVCLSTGEGPLVICDYNGNLLKKDTLIDGHNRISVMNGKLVLYDGLYKFLNGFDYYRGRAVDVYDVDTGVFIDFEDLTDVGMPGIKQFYPIKKEWWLYSTASRTYISNCRTSFVYALDTSLNIVPAFEYVHEGAKFPDEYLIVVPLIETDEYILFCNAMDYESQVKQRYKHGNWIFIKSEQKIYQLSDLGYLVDVMDDGRRHIMEEAFGSLVNDKVFFHTFCKTQNSDILVIPVDVEIAKNYMDKLPDNIREQVRNKQSGDNPLLVVMKFGKSIEKIKQ